MYNNTRAPNNAVELCVLPLRGEVQNACLHYVRERGSATDGRGKWVGTTAIWECYCSVVKSTIRCNTNAVESGLPVCHKMHCFSVLLRIYIILCYTHLWPFIRNRITNENHRITAAAAAVIIIIITAGRVVVVVVVVFTRYNCDIWNRLLFVLLQQNDVPYRRYVRGSDNQNQQMI